MTSLVVVNYRSSALAIDAIRTARAATAQPLQVVAVDNSCDAAEADALRPHADVVIAAETNLGYAGAINRGRRSCDGDAIVVSNPDVTFAPHAIDRLVEQLDERTAVAGPALFWDDAHTWLLPPGDRNTGWEKLDEILATRSHVWQEQRDVRRFRKRLAFWSLTAPTRVATLSGAVLAIRTRDFDDLGGFDERFRLYFEETDFLRRVTKRIVYVPAARVRHLYNQSAASSMGELYAESERKYLEKWNGPWAAGTLLGTRASRPLVRRRPAAESETLSGPAGGTPAFRVGDVVYEASPLEDFATAAGHFPQNAEVDVPVDVWRSLKDPVLHLRVVDRKTGAVLAKYTRYRT
jgi:N-acetylglucosaminyl-diphospho-decaprenol L-rhamnosyltransferase